MSDDGIELRESQYRRNSHFKSSGKKVPTVISDYPFKTKATVIVKKHALKVIDKKMKAKLGKLLLVVRIVFGFIYFGILYAQSFPDDLGWMTHPIYNGFSGFADVMSIEEWFDYLRDNVILAVMNHERYNGDPLDDPIQRNLFLDHDRLISPIVIMRGLIEIDGCDGIGVDIYPECYDDKFPFPNVFDTLNPVQINSEDYISVVHGNSTFFTDEGEDFYVIPSNISTPNDAILLVNDLQENLWVNRSTRSLRILFVLYNGNENFFLRVELAMSRRASAYIKSEIFVDPAKLEVYEDRVDFARLAFEILILILCGVMFFFDFKYVPEKLISKKGKIRYFSRRTFVPCIFYILFLLNVVLWIVFLISFANLDFTSSSNYAVDISLLNSVFETLQIYRFYSNIAVVNCYLLLIMFLTDLTLTSLFGVVSRTLQRAAADLAFFMIVFLVVTMVYLFIGFYYFAAVDEAFRTPIAGAESLFLWLLGEVSFEVLFDRRPISGHLYAWSWLILGSFILINMLVAMVLEAYLEVKEMQEKMIEYENKRKSISFFASIIKWFRRRLGSGDERGENKDEGRLTNRKIKRVLLGDDFKEKKIITEEELFDFTDWSREDVSIVIKRFGKSTRKIEKKNSNLGEIKRMLAHIYQKQIELELKVNELAEDETLKKAIPYDFNQPSWQYELHVAEDNQNKGMEMTKNFMNKFKADRKNQKQRKSKNNSSSSHNARDTRILEVQTDSTNGSEIIQSNNEST